jgi:NurA-like 5'-3' nuclease
MSRQFNLTENETRAALILVKSCLDGMGGTRPLDLDDDPYTWVAPDDLISKGYSKNEAAGTWGALLEKGVIEEVDTNEWALSDAAYRWLDTIWDAQA